MKFMIHEANGFGFILFVKLCEFHGFFGPKYKNYESRVNRLYGYKPVNMIQMYIFKGNFLENLDLTLGKLLFISYLTIV